MAIWVWKGYKIGYNNYTSIIRKCCELIEWGNTCIAKKAQDKGPGMSPNHDIKAFIMHIKLMFSVL